MDADMQTRVGLESIVIGSGLGDGGGHNERSGWTCLLSLPRRGRQRRGGRRRVGGQPDRAAASAVDGAALGRHRCHADRRRLEPGQRHGRVAAGEADRLEADRRPAETGHDQDVQDENDDERQQTVGDEAQVDERPVHEADQLAVDVLRHAHEPAPLLAVNQLDRPEHVTADVTSTATNNSS